MLRRAEEQVLAMVLALARRPQDWATGTVLRPTRAAVERHAPLFFGDALVDWSGAFARLARRGLLVEDGECRLTPGGERLAVRLRRRFLRDGFGGRLVRCDRSAAYGAFCERVFGIDLRQFSLLDAAQLDLLLDGLDVRRGHHVLDAGCGSGRVAEHVARTVGARVTGLDLATPALRLARRRTRDLGDRVCFVTRDLSTARRIPGPFDRILSIDSLYFTDDIHRTVALLHDALAPDGRLGVLASEVLPADGSDPGPRATPMHRAMVAAGFAVRVTDVTRHEHRIWRRQAEVVRGLEAAFEAEGNGQLALELRREAERSLGWIEEDRIRRYLYVARPARA